MAGNRTITFYHAGENLYGRRSVPEMHGLIGTRRVRKAVTYDNRFIHRTKNGVNDPLTFYHVLDLIAQMAPGSEFRTADLIAQLRTFKDQLVWDSPTVGRVTTDITESLNAAHGFTVIESTKRWNGMYYAIPRDGRASVAMYNLLEDLILLCEREIELELQGKAPKRLNSPMERCPSVAV